MSALVSQPGLSAAKVLSIPKDWNAAWFRGLVQNMLQGGDVRNAVGVNGIVVSGNISTPYAKITFGPGPVVLNTAAGTVALTINGASGTAAAEVININGALRGLQIKPSTSSQVAFEILDPGSNASGLRIETNNTSGSIIVFGVASTSLNITASGGTIIEASTDSSSYPLTVIQGATSGAYTAFLQGQNTAGFNGLLSRGGTTNGTDVAAALQNAAGTNCLTVFGDGGVVASSAPTGQSKGSGTVRAANGFYTNEAANMIHGTTAWTNGSGAGAGTLTNAPSAGNPTKWIAIDDAGTTRHIPAW